MTSGEVFNRDIDPLLEFAGAYPAFAPLIESKLISAAFLGHERRARRWKLAYTLLGRTALSSVLIVMILLAFRTTLKWLYGSPEYLDIIGAATGISGILAQFLIYAADVKRRWLISRFAAERMRGLKFQLFLRLQHLGAVASLRDDHQQIIKRALAELNEELRGGLAALAEFSPTKTPLITVTNPPILEDKYLVEAFTVYNRLRLQVQLQHFESQAENARERSHFPISLSKFLLLASGLTASSESVITGWLILGHVTSSSVLLSTQSWLAFLTWSFFSLGSAVAIFQRGSGDQISITRYEQYAREIRHAYVEPKSFQQFYELVIRMERISLCELKDFIRDSAPLSYII